VRALNDALPRADVVVVVMSGTCARQGLGAQRHIAVSAHGPSGADVALINRTDALKRPKLCFGSSP
jgi:hypothetical protein